MKKDAKKKDHAVGIPADKHELFDGLDCRPDFDRDTGHKNLPGPPPAVVEALKKAAAARGK